MRPHARKVLCAVLIGNVDQLLIGGSTGIVEVEGIGTDIVWYDKRHLLIRCGPRVYIGAIGGIRGMTGSGGGLIGRGCGETASGAGVAWPGSEAYSKEVRTILLFHCFFIVLCLIAAGAGVALFVLNKNSDGAILAALGTFLGAIGAMLFKFYQDTKKNLDEFVIKVHGAWYFVSLLLGGAPPAAARREERRGPPPSGLRLS
jgi:hypothetical protein